MLLAKYKINLDDLAPFVGTFVFLDLVDFKNLLEYWYNELLQLIDDEISKQSIQRVFKIHEKLNEFDPFFLYKKLVLTNL